MLQPHSRAPPSSCVATAHHSFEGTAIAVCSTHQAGHSTYSTLLCTLLCARSSTVGQGQAKVNSPLQFLLYRPTCVLPHPSLPHAHSSSFQALHLPSTMPHGYRRPRTRWPLASTTVLLPMTAKGALSWKER